jgi:hypothetical protein
MTTFINPQVGHITTETLTVPAGGWRQLPRPLFTGSYLELKAVAFLYQFQADNTDPLTLVVDGDGTSGQVIPATTAWNYGGEAISVFDAGYFRYLYNPAGAPVDITVVVTRLR